MTRRMITRRRFLRNSAAAIAAPYVITSTALGTQERVPAAERIVMGSIGLGARGVHVMESFLANGEVQMVAVCDVQQGRRESAKARAS